MSEIRVQPAMLRSSHREVEPVPLPEASIAPAPGRPAAGWRARSTLYQIGLGVVILCLSTRGLTNESTVSLQGDMPRYLMNGVYFHDLIRDLPLTDPIGYTQRYFAKYPALSLGHHPLLLGWAEAPLYAVFGISVLAGRMTVLLLLLLGALAWFRTVRRLYDDETAFFATALLVTTPFVVRFSHVVMSEVPTLALVLVSTFFLLRYCDELRRRDVFLFAITAALSCYSKQLAVLLLPIYMLYFVMRHGVRALLRREVLLAGLLLVVLLAPLVPITYTFSRVNVRWVENAGGRGRFAAENLTYYVWALWHHHLTTPLLVASVIGAVISGIRRDGRALFFVLWIVGFYAGITYMGVQDPRFAIYWIPSFCLLAASTLACVRTRRLRMMVATGLTVIAAYQCVAAYRLTLSHAAGYEEAARYVTQHPKGQSVLYSARVDSGYFVFFVRKSDPEEDLVVLRADKTLVTSGMKRIMSEQVSTPEEIYAVLKTYGVGYVVIEDLQYYSKALELLHQQLRTDEFELRKRIPISSSDSDLNGVDLAIYEFKGYTPANRDAPLRMQIPLMRGEVAVRFGDLLPPEDGGR